MKPRTRLQRLGRWFRLHYLRTIRDAQQHPEDLAW